MSHSKEIWKVGHEDDGYSYILVIAESEGEAVEIWKKDFAEERKSELLREANGTADKGFKTFYTDILKNGPEIVENFGTVISLGDGGYDLP